MSEREFYNSYRLFFGYDRFLKMAVIDQYFVYVMILDYVLQLSALAYPIYIFKNDQDQFYVFIAIGIGATAFRSLFLCLAGCCGGKVHWTWYGLFMLLRIICSLCLIQTLSSLAFQKQNLDGFFVYDIEGIMVAFMWDILYLATLFFFQESN